MISLNNNSDNNFKNVGDRIVYTIPKIALMQDSDIAHISVMMI